MSDFTPWPEFKQAMKHRSRCKKEQNRIQAKTLLKQNNIPYGVYNNGHHWVLEPASGPRAGQKIDYWPGTGVWIPRIDKTTKRRGVLKLLKYLGAPLAL